MNKDLKSAGNAGNAIGRVISNRMREEMQTPDQLELGTVQPDMSILTDSFARPISNYMVNRHLKLQNPMTTTKADETGHQHQVERPAELDPLKPGDRVLVAWSGAALVVLFVVDER